MHHVNATREVSAQDQVDLCLVRADQILQLLERVKSTEITDKRYEVSGDTSELKTTLERVKKVLAFGTIKLIEGSLDVFCIVAIQASLDQLKKILLQQEACVTFSSWCDTKIKLYNLDLQLYFQLDQVVALFSGNSAFDAAELFTDQKNIKMWQELFGRQARLVPCNEFLTKFVAYLNADDKLYNYSQEELGFIGHFLDFTRDDLVSPYKVHIFTRWFGPIPNCFDRLLESLRTGYLTGFMSAHEANWMLRKKPSGTFLIRFSKSQAGCFAVTFVDSKGQVKHSLLYSLTDQWGLTLKNPPKVYKTLSEFVLAHANNLSSPLGNKWMSQLDKPKTSPILAGSQAPGRPTGDDPMESPDSPPESHVTSLRTSNPKIKRDTSQHYFPLSSVNNNGAVVENNLPGPAMGGEKNMIHVMQNMTQNGSSRSASPHKAPNMTQSMYTQSNYSSAQSDELLADPALTRVIRDSTFTQSSIANYQQINQALLNYQGSPEQYQMYHADTMQQPQQFSATQLNAHNLLMPHRPLEQQPQGTHSSMNLGLKSPKPIEPSCTVCMDHPRTTLFLECAHRACCKECSRKVTFCPVCRQPITRVVDIYTP